MAKIFISYKSEDHKFAFELDQQLRDAGFDTWIDKKRLRAGEDWREEIDDGIRQSFAMVLILSPAVLDSPKYVIYEFAFAWGFGIKVVPVMFKSIELKDFHPRIVGRQYEDFQDGRRPWPKLALRLKEIQDGRNIEEDSASAFVLQAVGRLEDLNENERKRAIQNLVESDDPAAFKALVNALTHHLSDVRINAAIKLMEIIEPPDERALPGLLEALADTKDQTRKVAQREIRKFGAQAIEGLIGVLDNNFSEGRYCAATMLGELKAKSAVPRLVRLLDDTDWKVVVAALDALEAIGDPSAIAPLSARLDDPNEHLQERVAKVLVSLGDDSPVPYLLIMLRNTDGAKSNQAAELLTKIGGDKVIAGTVEALEGKSPDVRELAAKILGVLKSYQGVKQLVQVLDDSEIRVRRASIVALGNIRDASVVRQLLPLLDDEDDGVRRDTIIALGGLGSDVAVPKLIELVKDRTVAVPATEALGRIGNPIATQALLDNLRDESVIAYTDITTVTLWALGEIGNSSAVPDIARFLSDERMDTRIEGIDTGTARILEVRVRLVAKNALEDIGTPEALEAIKKWQLENDESV